jgi:hypothetical protein
MEQAKQRTKPMPSAVFQIMSKRTGTWLSLYNCKRRRRRDNGKRLLVDRGKLSFLSNS